MPNVVGGYGFELNNDGYEIIAFAAHPNSPLEARSAMLDDLIDRSKKSEDRKKLSMNVPDSDSVTLEVLMNKGWRLRTPDRFERVSP